MSTNPSPVITVPPGSWVPSDSGILGWTFDPMGGSTVSSPLATAGTLYTSRLPLRSAGLVTNLWTWLITAGGTLTAGQCFGALYQNGTLLGVTADQSTNWAGAAGQLSMAIAGGPVAALAGYVDVGFWFNGTTGPAFLRNNIAGGEGNFNLAGASLRFATANTGLTTTAPGSLGAKAAATNDYFAAVN